MIRINLLPVRQAKKREYGRQQLILFVVLILLEGAVFYMLHNTKKQELDSLRGHITEMEQEATRRDELIREIATIDQQISRIDQNTNRVRSLMQGRIGPGAVLDDLRFMLLEPRNPVEEIEQDERAFNNVDPRGIWIERLTVSQGNFSMSGVAVSHSAMAEFMHRLDTAPRDLRPFFVRPQLSNYRTDSDPYFGEVKRFEISGGVRYQRMALH